MIVIGQIDIEKYRCISGSIRTSEVIITEERIQHIQDRHPNDFERYFPYIKDMVEDPQYILEANRPNTAFIVNQYHRETETFRLVLRLAVEGGPPEYKNAVITFLKISARTWDKYLRNKKILYKSE